MTDLQSEAGAEPLSPDLVVDTSTASPEVAVASILSHLAKRGFLPFPVP